MADADLVLAYIKALAWPTIVVVVLILFRSPLKALLGAIEEFEGFGVRAKIGQRLTQAATAAEQSLAQDPPHDLSRTLAYRGGPDGRHWIGARETASRMEIAMKFTNSSGEGVAAHSVERMRISVDALDMAVNAVLVVVATSGWPSLPDAEQHRFILATWIENQLVDLTGFSGWAGIIRSRNILRGALSAVCGKAARRVSPQEVITIINAAESAHDRLRRLVSDFANSLNLNA